MSINPTPKSFAFKECFLEYVMPVVGLVVVALLVTQGLFYQTQSAISAKTANTIKSVFADEMIGPYEYKISYKIMDMDKLGLLRCPKIDLITDSKISIIDRSEGAQCESSPLFLGGLRSSVQVTSVSGTTWQISFLSVNPESFDTNLFISRIGLSVILIVSWFFWRTRSQLKSKIRFMHLAAERDRFQAIAETTSRISHDLLSPLAVFQRVAYGDSNDYINERSRMQRALKRIRGMANSIKKADTEAIIRPEVGKLDLSDLLDDLAETAKGSNKSLIANCPVIKEIYLDFPKVERVITNLVDNAIRAAKTYVKLSWRVEGNKFILECIDNGPGLDPKIADRAFESGVSGRMDGTGIGLSFVKETIEGHGGQVSYSRVGHETRFVLKLSDCVHNYQNKTSPVTAGARAKVNTSVYIRLEDSKIQEAIKSSLRDQGIAVSENVDNCGILFTDDPGLLSRVPGGVRPIIQNSPVDVERSVLKIKQICC